MLTLKLAGGVILNPVIFGVLLFVPAGTLDWWRAWVLMGVVLIATTATMIGVFRHNEGLLDERYRAPIQQGQPVADRIVVLSLLAAFFGLMILIPIDVFHLHLMRVPGPAVSWIGLALFIAGWTVVAIAMGENSFAAPVVRYQRERGQIVIDRGLYGVVRHPMYAGALLLMFGMPLWLGSYAAALWALVPIAVMATRAVIEERFLRGALEGYDDYMNRTRYRLIPFVW